MAHSFCRIYIHVIFSTKDRKRWLEDKIRSRVHGFIATLARNAGCPFVVVGGPDDHVHILAEVSKDIHPVEMIGRIKQESSKFIKTLGSEYSGFYWQAGYGMFSVGPTRVDDVKAYVEGQVQHHRRQTYKDELRAFLDRYRIEYNEKYVCE